MAARMPQISGAEHRYVEVRGLRMHYVEAGEGEPVVMLHGFPQHWYMWRALIPPLARRYRVIAPDLRGAGWTDAPADGYEKENMAEDVVGFLDALGLDRVKLIGHDWGGFVGFILCVRHPERFARYLALNITPLWPVATPRSALEIWRLWYQVVIAAPKLGEYLLARPGFVKECMRGSARDKKAWTGTEMAAFTGPFEEPARAKAGSLLYRSFLLRELVPFVGGRYRAFRLTTPTLLLFGTHDMAISTHFLNGYEPYSDDMRVELVETSGHWIAEEVPDLVTERAIEFFGAAAPGAEEARATGA